LMVFAFAGDSTMTRFFCSIKKETAINRGIDNQRLQVWVQ